MLQLIESFDVFAPLDYTKRGWSALFTGYATGRFGTGQSMSISTATYKATRAASSATVFVQTGFKSSITSGEIPIFQGYQAGASQFVISYNFSTSVFNLYRGSLTGALVATSGSAALGSGQWQLIEAQVGLSATVGTFILKLNGSIIVNLSGLNTLSTATASIDAIGFGGGGLASWDDFICFDSAGLPPNAFIGDQRIDAIVPISDGTHLDFTPTTGTSHFAMVNETTPNAATEVHASVTGNMDTYGMTQTPTGAAILAIQINMSCFKDSAGVRTIAPVIRKGTIDYVGIARTPGTSETILSQIYEQDPSTSAAFTLSDLNSEQLGVKLVA